MEDKKMKKVFSVLLAIALIATVGGVYATWNYIQDQGASSATDTFTVKLAGESISNADIGTIEVIAQGGIIIDDVDGDHKADIVWEEGSKFDIIVTPKAGYTIENLKAMGVTLSYTLSVEGIFGYNHESNLVDNSISLVWSRENGVIDFTEDGTQLTTTIVAQSVDKVVDGNTYKVAANFSWKQGSTVVDGVYLPTYEDYLNYENAITAAKITITVTDTTDYPSIIPGI